MGRAITISSGIFLSTGGFLFGYDSGIITSTIGQPAFIEYFGAPDAATTGGIVAGFSAGAVLGSLAAGWLGDILGRKKTVFVGGCISTIGCSLQTGAATVGMLIAGRILAGMAVGILTAAVPMYCSEIAEASYRGALSGLLQWMLCWGFLFAQWIGYGCNYINSSFQWRFPLAVQVIPSVLLATGVWLLQESPRWLMEKGRYEEAREALRKLHGDGMNDEYLDLEYREIRDTIVAEKAIAVRSWSGLISRPTWRRRLLLGCGIQIFGQLSGINVINYYGVTIYKLLGFSTRDSLLIIGLSGSLSLIECSIALYFLERLGRIKLMIFSASGMACALVVNAVLSQYFIEADGAHTVNENALRAMVAMNFVFNPFFFTFTGVISWVYNAEIFPVEIRARGNSLATLSNWSIGLIIGQISPIALEAIGFRYFYAFFVFNLVAAICYAVFYPDTKGRTLEQMDTIFGDQVVPKALEDPPGAPSTTEGFEKDQKVAHAEKV